MEITFTNSKMQKTCNSASKLKGEFGPRMATVIQQRLFELLDCDTLEEMKNIQGARCHELGENLKGYLAIYLVHPDRLLFEVADDPIPRKDDGGLDWTKVRRIRIVKIGDYH